jgi:tetratricopeptide (TPR) repeat protein
LKQQGNQCVRNANFTEAILHYSHAIKLNGIDPILYSNRSLAFLKLKQIYYANEDADKTIELKPDWVKGHFRKAEALCAAGSYDMALLSYGRALRLQPSDAVIIHSAKSCASLCNQDAMCKC